MSKLKIFKDYVNALDIEYARLEKEAKKSTKDSLNIVYRATGKKYDNISLVPKNIINQSILILAKRATNKKFKIGV